MRNKKQKSLFGDNVLEKPLVLLEIFFICFNGLFFGEQPQTASSGWRVHHRPEVWLRFLCLSLQGVQA
jgi:hypothetical protein